MPFIYSTKTSATTYASYVTHVDAKNAPKYRDRSVTIAGGANTADKNFHTATGVSTKITDDELAFLEKNPVFQLHCKNGFLTVDKNKVPANRVANDLTPRDRSAPLTPDSVKAEKEKAKKKS